MSVAERRALVQTDRLPPFATLDTDAQPATVVNDTGGSFSERSMTALQGSATQSPSNAEVSKGNGGLTQNPETPSHTHLPQRETACQAGDSLCESGRNMASQLAFREQGGTYAPLSAPEVSVLGNPPRPEHDGGRAAAYPVGVERAQSHRVVTGRPPFTRPESRESKNVVTLGSVTRVTGLPHPPEVVSTTSGRMPE